MRQKQNKTRKVIVHMIKIVPMAHNIGYTLTRLPQSLNVWPQAYTTQSLVAIDTKILSYV